MQSDCAAKPLTAACSLLMEVYINGRLMKPDPASAAAYLNQSCDLGNGRACNALGRQNPFPNPYTPAQGTAFVQNVQATVNQNDCTVSGNPLTCLLAGVALVEGIGVPQNVARGVSDLSSACAAGNAQACSERDCASGNYAACATAGLRYSTGANGTPLNPDRARGLLQRACDHSVSSACQNLAALPKPDAPALVGQEVAADGAILDYTMQQASGCDHQSAGACSILAQMFAYGLDLPKDTNRALFYYDKACTMGDSTSCTVLGRYYGGPLYVLPVPRGPEPQPPGSDAHLGASYFKRAFELNQTVCNAIGLPIPCYDLADAYARGEGVAQDIARAEQMLDYDCGFFQFGFMCRRARELRQGKPDPPGAEERLLTAAATAISLFYARDCDGGGVPACGELGDFYAVGHGVPTDLAHAKVLLTSACAAGVQGYCTDLAKVPGGGLLAHEQLCQLGDTANCILAGDDYAANSSNRNLDKAAAFYESACSRGSSAGCQKLMGIGDLYRLGQTVIVDLDRARSLYRDGCALSDALSCDRLVALGKQEEALGGTANQDAAVLNYSDACGYGSSSGCAELWRVAGSVLADHARAIWDRACNGFPGVVGACNNLGVMYELGQGGLKDPATALQLYKRACSRGNSPACTNFWYLEGSLNSVTWTITDPVVTQRETVIPQIVFQPNDIVYVKAGGCVQTGGSGLTWKRYVDPSGDNSDRQYHGRIWIPGGATDGLQTLPGVIGRWLSVKAIPHSTNPSDYYLRIGYDDNNYDDNGYYSHDDGTGNQCLGVGDAYIILTIEHHSQPLNEPTIGVQLAPMDLWWSAIDDNQYPLNPLWGQQATSKIRPNAGPLCNYFADAGDHLSLGTPACTTQAPTVDAPDLLANGPIMFGICQADLQQDEPLLGSSVRGHVNWGPVTYTGKIYFDDFNIAPFSSIQVFSDGDGDYDWALVRDDEAGTVAGNRFQYRTVGNHGLTLEFHSNEVVDRIDSTWWAKFHAAVDSHPANAGDWTAAQALVDGHDAKVIGLMGIDTKHTVHAELHPVFAMAIKISETSTREAWAVFARNWGDEGGCSQDQHYLPSNNVTFFFPNGGGADYQLDSSASNIRVGGGAGTWGARNYTDGMVVTFGLPDPSQQVLIFGELQLCKGPCIGGTLPLIQTSSSMTAEPLSTTDDEAARKHAESEEREIDEASLAHLTALLSPEQRARLELILRERPLAVANSRPMASTTPRNDDMVQSRHRMLNDGEPRILTPAFSAKDPARGANGVALFEALSQAVGGAEEARAILRKLQQ